MYTGTPAATGSAQDFEIFWRQSLSPIEQQLGYGHLLWEKPELGCPTSVLRFTAGGSQQPPTNNTGNRTGSDGRCWELRALA